MTTYTVTTLVDESDTNATVGTPGGTGLSLREAIALANADAAADTIRFASNLTGGNTTANNGRITLSGTELAITAAVTIDGDVNGDGAPDITISGNNLSRVFNIKNLGTFTVNLNGLVIRDGSDAFGGAGILNDQTLLLTNSVVTANRAVNSPGGGISNHGDATIVNTTISNNSAIAGGGVVNANGTLDLQSAFDPAYKLAGSGDFNHAGGADVLWHNATTGQVGTWLLHSI